MISRMVSDVISGLIVRGRLVRGDAEGCGIVDFAKVFDKDLARRGRRNVKNTYPFIFLTLLLSCGNGRFANRPIALIHAKLGPGFSKLLYIGLQLSFNLTDQNHVVAEGDASGLVGGNLSFQRGDADLWLPTELPALMRMSAAMIPALSLAFHGRGLRQDEWRRLAGGRLP